MNFKPLIWKDVTSYSRDAKERNPTTFEVRSGALRVVITCGHMIYRPKWIMHCFSLAIDTRQLKAATQELAEAEAIAIVYDRLNELKSCADSLFLNGDR